MLHKAIDWDFIHFALSFVVLGGIVTAFICGINYLL